MLSTCGSSTASTAAVRAAGTSTATRHSPASTAATRVSGAADKAVDDLFAAGLVKGDVEFAAIDGDDIAHPEFLMEHTVADGEFLAWLLFHQIALAIDGRRRSRSVATPPPAITRAMASVTGAGIVP